MKFYKNTPPYIKLDDSIDVRTDILQECLKSSKWGKLLFEEDEIHSVSKLLVLEELNKIYITCQIRGRLLMLKPEEIIRQWYLNRLIYHYEYNKSRIKVEYPIQMGASTKKADIVILNEKDHQAVDIIVELKKPQNKDGREQLKSYCNASGAPVGIWTNGDKITYYHRKEPNLYINLTDIPKSSQSIADLIQDKYTLKDLIVNDKVANQKKSLREIIIELEDEVFANSGEDVFEEIFKLIFIKLCDEDKSHRDKAVIDNFVKSHLTQTSDYESLQNFVRTIDDSNFRILDFRNRGEPTNQLKDRLQDLFNEAKEKWKGIFENGDKLQLQPDHLAVCVSSLQDVKLFNSNLMVIDDAFEYLISKNAKGVKGQFFTPRHVIDMCVKMLNPQHGEYMIDTASGSSGFPVHTIFHLTGQLFTDRIVDMDPKYKRNIRKIFGIDFDKAAVRVARTLNLIAGDGASNVIELNTLDYTRWESRLAERDWEKRNGSGYDELIKLRLKKKDNRQFNFDILMANPPFAGEIKEGPILSQYELARRPNSKTRDKVERHILFLERNLDFLKPGGRMAIVLPEGILNNPSQKYIREYLFNHARLLAVVSLHENTFKPHTGTKTSVLFLQKWTDKNGVCPKASDYEIFFASSLKSGKDNSGDYVFVTNKKGRSEIDSHGHLMIDHDLHDQDGLTEPQIAEQFINWAIKQKLSFRWEENEK